MFSQMVGMCYRHGLFLLFQQRKTPVSDTSFLENYRLLVKSRPPFPIDKEQILYLLKDGADNIRPAKTQQWQVGYYTLIGYGAVIGAILSLVIDLIGMIVILNLSCSMEGYRKSMEEAEKSLLRQYKAISKNGGPNRLLHSWMIIFVIVGGGGVITVWMILKYLGVIL